MSIKLSLKELKDLLKIQNKKIKSKRRKRNKKRLPKAQQNNIRSSSEHMLSSGVTMMNSSNEQSELIRLQRQALEDKLKEDKQNKIKKEAKEQKAKEQNIQDNSGGLVPFDPLTNNGGSNKLRDLGAEIDDLKYGINHLMYNWGQSDRVEELDNDEMEGEEVRMPTHNPKIPTNPSNIELLKDDDEEEVIDFTKEGKEEKQQQEQSDKKVISLVDEEKKDDNTFSPKAYFETDQPEALFETKQPTEIPEKTVAKKASGFRSNSTALTLIGYIQTNKEGKAYSNKTLMNKSREELFAIALGIREAAADKAIPNEEKTDKKKKKKDATV